MPHRALPGLRESREGRPQGRPRSRLTGFLVVTLALVSGPLLAADAPLPLPPVQQRPFVVVDGLKNMGLLLPSGQEALKAVISALIKRYGNEFVVIEDELISKKRLRKMSGGKSWLPVEAQKDENIRMALLEWAVKEAPYRITIGFKSLGKGKGFQASAECRERGAKTPLHRVEGTGKTYDSTVEDLAKHLKTFCGVLDGAFEQRKKGVLPSSAPAP